MGLGSNQHNLTLYADPTTNTGPFIDVDAIAVYSTSGGSNNQTASGPLRPQQPQRQVNHVLKHVLSLINIQNSEAKHSKMSQNTMIGIIVGSVFGFLLLLALVFFLVRWRRRRRQKQDEMLSPLTPTLPFQQPDVLEAGLSTRPSGTSRVSQNSMTSFYSDPSNQDAGFLGHSRQVSDAETTSTAPIISATVSRNQAMSSVR